MAKTSNLSKIKKRICFHLDGVICKTKKNYYNTAQPIKSNIKIVKERKPTTGTVEDG